MDIKKRIIDFCINMGIYEVGFCQCKTFGKLGDYLENRKKNGLQNEFEGDNIYIRINPNYYLKEGKTIISLAFPYFFSNKNKGRNYFSVYTRGLDYHKVVSQYLKELCLFISSLGGSAKYFVDSNCLPERYIAWQCGLGFIGKNNMLINENYGSYLFLGEVITDLELEPDKPIKNECGSCELCLNVCPTKAINRKENNGNVCLSYITQKKDIEDFWFSKFNGRIFGCDSCQNICPFNREVKISEIKEFKPFDFMTNVNVKELINLDSKVFNEKYRLTSAGWRGKNVIKRNALISVLSTGHSYEGLYVSKKSEYLWEYYNRLLQYFKL